MLLNRPRSISISGVSIVPAQIAWLALTSITGCDLNQWHWLWPKLVILVVVEISNAGWGLNTVYTISAFIVVLCRGAVQITHQNPVGYTFVTTCRSKILIICSIMRYVFVRVSLGIRDKTFKFFLILFLITRFRWCPQKLSLLSRRFFSSHHSYFASVIFILNFIFKLLPNYRQLAFEIYSSFWNLVHARDKTKKHLSLFLYGAQNLPSSLFNNFI